MGYLVYICTVIGFLAVSISCHPTSLSQSNHNVSVDVEPTSDSRQLGVGNLTQYLQEMARNALDAISLLFSSFWTYSLTNLAIPESVNTLIPMRRWLGWWRGIAYPRQLPMSRSIHNRHEKREQVTEEIDTTYLIGELAAAVLSFML